MRFILVGAKHGLCPLPLGSRGASVARSTDRGCTHTVSAGITPRGRLFAPVSPARDPVPAPLHRRKATREVRRRILSGRFARFGIRFTPTRSGAASGFHLDATLGAKKTRKLRHTGGAGATVRWCRSPRPAMAEKRPIVRHKSPKTATNRRQPPKNGTLSGPQRNKRSRWGILL